MFCRVYSFAQHLCQRDPIVHRCVGLRFECKFVTQKVYREHVTVVILVMSGVGAILLRWLEDVPYNFARYTINIPCAKLSPLLFLLVEFVYLIPESEFIWLRDLLGNFVVLFLGFGTIFL